MEHQSAKELIARIEAGAEADDMFDAKVKVLDRDEVLFASSIPGSAGHGGPHPTRGV